MFDMTSIQDAALIATARRMSASGEARQIRIACDLPIGDVARSVGVDVATLWRWENGKRSPRGERAARYARVLASLVKEQGR